MGNIDLKEKDFGSGFYDRCEALAKEKGINMKQLGEEVGVTGASITGWKNGSVPRVDVAFSVAKYFGVTVEYLFSGENLEYTLNPEEKNLIEWYRKTSLKKSILKLAKELSTVTTPYICIENDEEM